MTKIKGIQRYSGYMYYLYLLIAQNGCVNGRMVDAFLMLNYCLGFDTSAANPREYEFYQIAF